LAAATDISDDATQQPPDTCQVGGQAAGVCVVGQVSDDAEELGPEGGAHTWQGFDDFGAGTLAECDRVGDSRASYSHKHRRYGVNVQVITDPTSGLPWISPALPGRDLTAARTHKIICICERQGVPVLADRAYIGAGPWVTTPIRRPPYRELTPTQRTRNRALSAA
jgi:hypothetical protein